ncbi:hypothetical protein [Methylophilus aquaticus]|uniref:Uncharacterized protein n=1 Tax=Methylophilus aquaticus TaxID=1971610 RepID=A0ABT9JWA5_9PROT|nr:hypothetical protein [Methylophilus aquaticus]MDP8568862.1 hypothetical protein [Methylophilus aquaticus]
MKITFLDDWAMAWQADLPCAAIGLVSLREQTPQQYQPTPVK